MQVVVIKQNPDYENILLAVGNGNTLQYSCLENSVGYSPLGRKDSDMTEWLHFILNVCKGSLLVLEFSRDVYSNTT